MQMLTLAGCGEVPGEDLGEGVWQVIADGQVKIGIITSSGISSEYLASDINTTNGLVVLCFFVVKSKRRILFRRI